MWVEAILGTEDLSQLVAQLLPMTIHLGDGTLSLSDPKDISLLPDVGLRATCRGHVHWPLLGIEVPVALNLLTVILRPEIARCPRGSFFCGAPSPARLALSWPLSCTRTFAGRGESRNARGVPRRSRGFLVE